MIPHGWDDDPMAFYGDDPKSLVPKSRRLRLWHVVVMVILCVFCMGTSGVCGFRSVKFDHAADTVAQFNVQAEALGTLPAKQVVSVVNEGRLLYDPMMIAVAEADPRLARFLQGKWDDLRSLTIVGDMSYRKLGAVREAAGEVHVQLRDQGEVLRRWAIVFGALAALSLMASGWVVWWLMSQGTEPLVIQKLIVQSRPTEQVSTASFGGDEWVFDAGRRHFENTFARLPVACCSFNSDGKITAWNSAMEATTGHREGEVLQHSFWQLMQWDKLSELGQNAKYRLLQGEPVDGIEWVYEHPVGEKLDFKATLIPVTGATGGVVSAVAAISDVTLQKRQERMLVENDVTKTAMLAAIPDTLIRLDAEGRLVDLKDNAALIAESAGRLMGTGLWRTVVGHELADAILAAMKAARQARTYVTHTFHSTVGPERHLDIRAAMCGPSDVLVILHDTADRHRAEMLMRDSEARLRYLIEGSADILTLVDANGIVTYQSPAVSQALGYGETELLGRHLKDFIDEDNKQELFDTLDQLKANKGGKARFYVRMAHKDGTMRDLEVHGRNLLENTYVNAIVLNVRDVTERMGLERELHRKVLEVQKANSQLEDANRVLAQRATTDGLTGLTNHRTAQEYLLAAVTHCQRQSCPVSLAIIDVDFFKKINDTHGHQEGDRVLQWLAEKVKGVCRKLHMAARYGGEEFVLIMPNTASDEAFEIVEGLRHQIARSYERGYPITVSIGLVTSDSVVETSASLFATADKALYASKQGGRNRVTAVNQSRRAA